MAVPGMRDEVSRARAAVYHSKQTQSKATRELHSSWAPKIWIMNNGTIMKMKELPRTNMLICCAEDVETSNASH